MPIFRVEKTKNYTVMSNLHLKDDRLTLKAKGLMSVMLSLPDDWDYSMPGLVALTGESNSALKTILKELKDVGYLTITKKFPNETSSGKIEYQYCVYEKPSNAEESTNQEVEKQAVENQAVEKQALENQAVEKQALENQALENQAVENPPLNKILNILNTKELNIKELNTEETNICDGVDDKARTYACEDNAQTANNHRLLDRRFGMTVEVRNRVVTEAIRLFTSYFGRQPTDSEIDCLFGYISGIKMLDGKAGWIIDDKRLSLCEYAFKEASKADICNLRYVEGILSKLQSRGIETIEDAEDYDLERSD